MSEQAEDPVGHAAATLTSYVSIAAMAAEALAQVAGSRARERAATDQQAAAASRAQRHAAHGQARLTWATVLDPTTRFQASAAQTGAAWAHAQAWHPDPEAARAAALAEQRLRELRPDAMDRYDRLRQGGADPVDAMRRVAPLFDQPPARPGEAAPDRAALVTGTGTGTGTDVRSPVVIAREGYPRPLGAAALAAAKRQTDTPAAAAPRQQGTHRSAPSRRTSGAGR